MFFLLACTSEEVAPPKERPETPTDSDPDTVVHWDSGRDSDHTPDGDDTGPHDTGWDPLADSDSDGITDTTEGRGADDASSRDTDEDGTPDYLDLVADGDALRDAMEGTPVEEDGGPADTDGDGTPDYLDDDSDDDGILDSVEGNDDWDGDGTENWRDAMNDGSPDPLLFEAITTEFNSPIGIDYHEYTSSVVLSVNYPYGTPVALERVASDGSHETFSSLTGVTDEVKIATARSGNEGGFTAGELFVGNGADGQIVRISEDGGTIDNPWVDLGAGTNGLMRGSLYVDRTGVWDGNLVVVTTVGQVWEIDSAGNAMLIVDVGVHLEGLITVPDAPARFGPLAGTILCGAEEQGLLYAIESDGTFTTYNVGVAVEDIDYVEPWENFFGVNYGTSRLIGVGGYNFLPIAGDILLTQETVTSVGLFRLWWDGSALRTEELRADPSSATIGQWEHVTFADAGIQEVP